MSSSSLAGTVATPRRLRIDSRRRWLPDLRALLRSRQILALLSRREITVKYRQTVFGTLWIFTGPLVSAGLFSFVFGKVAGLSSDGVPYFAFSYAALLGWNLFAEALAGASKSLISNTGLITKIYFPRLILPLSTVSSTLINAVISFGVMVVLILIYDLGFSIQMVLLPFWLLLALLLALGFGICLTAVAVLYRDINYLTPVLIPLLLYVTPVAYSSSEVPHNLRYIHLLNPMSTVAEGCRWSLLGTGRPTTWAIAYTVAVTVGVVMLGLTLFARLEGKFADVV